ncbi:MAG: zinc ribbon domain-containing protein [Gemmatimonadales bacterium]
MDELDRLFGLLVAALARETRVAIPFPAAEIYERLVPYRSNRSRLNVATHQDYEMAVLRLLAGERGYVQLEPETVRDAMQREIATINPDPAYFRSFPEAQVMVNGRAADRVLLAERAYAPPSDDDDDDLLDTTGENPIPPPASPAPAQHFVPPERFRVARPAQSISENQCEYCGGVLPSNRDARFCPHCGQPQEGDLKCPACGSAVDVGWAYCLACGKPTGFE